MLVVVAMRHRSAKLRACLLKLLSVIKTLLSFFDRRSFLSSAHRTASRESFKVMLLDVKWVY